MRAKFVNEFTRGSDPLSTLGIGRVGMIRKWFRDLNISDERYEITPTEVIFKDTLDLRNTNVTWLPDGLKVSGDLNLSGCTGLTSLPDGLKVSMSLYLNGCIGLTYLPDGLKVDWNLWLRGCTGLTSLPDGLKVSRDLYLGGCTGLTSLPDDLIVKYRIWVNSDQKRLIDWIRSSKFNDMLR